MPEDLKKRVRNALIDVITQVRSGDKEPAVSLSDSTSVGDDLGMSSLQQVEIAVLLSEKLSVEIDDAVVLAPDPQGGTTIGQIVDAVLREHGGQVAATLKSDDAVHSREVTAKP